MSLCRDPVIFLLSEAVKLIEESPAKKSKEYFQTDFPVRTEKFPKKKLTLEDKIEKVVDVAIFYYLYCQCLLCSLSQIQSFDFFLTSHQKVVIL